VKKFLTLCASEELVERRFMAAKQDDCLNTMSTSQLLAEVTAAAPAAEESNWNAQHQTNKQELLSFQLLPRELVEPRKMTPHDKEAGEVLFQPSVQYSKLMS
jgi:hypothetical protein